MKIIKNKKAASQSIKKKEKDQNSVIIKLQDGAIQKLQIRKKTIKIK